MAIFFSLIRFPLNSRPSTTFPPWVEIECSRCKTKRDVGLAQLPRFETTFVHDLATRLRCQRCAKAGKRPAATLLQLAFRARHVAEP
jgi:hypothetical protein